MNRGNLSCVIYESFEGILTLLIQVEVLKVIDDTQMIEIHSIVTHVCMSLLKAFQVVWIVQGKILVVEDLSGATCFIGML
jgi:hypothetical protein